VLAIKVNINTKLCVKIISQAKKPYTCVYLPYRHRHHIQFFSFQKICIFFILVSVSEAVLDFVDGMGNMMKNKTIIDRMVVYFIESSDMYDDDELPTMKEEIVTQYSEIDRRYLELSRFDNAGRPYWTVQNLRVFNSEILALAERMLIYQQKSVDIFRLQLAKTIRHQSDDDEQIDEEPDR
jgi:hypothetical protein